MCHILYPTNQTQLTFLIHVCILINTMSIIYLDSLFSYCFDYLAIEFGT